MIPPSSLATVLHLVVASIVLLAGCSEPVAPSGCKVTAECPSGQACRAGRCQPSSCDDCVEGEVCVAGLCLPPACGDRPCREGEGCYEGSCVSADCVEVSCPEGQACAQGQCFAALCGEQPCVDGVCWNERCVAPACVGVSCADGEVCVQGSCHPANCVGVLCVEGAACVDGRCQEVACAGISCPAGSRCMQGRCAAISCAGGACPEGQVCQADRCVDPGCVAASCPEGRRCASATCVLCSEAETACADGVDEDCDSSVDCADADCRASESCRCPAVPCADTERCVAGSCLPASCGDHPCHQGQGCVDGHCLSQDCLAVECPSGLVCGAGLCFAEDCSSRDCAAGDLCVGGQCTFGGCVGVVCPSDQSCADGRCLPLGCAQGACADGAVCVEAACTPKSCVGISCPPGQRCATGRCLPEGCEPGVACPGREVCDDGACADLSCAGLQCPQGKRCQAAGCVDCTATESECGDGQDNDCNGAADCHDPACAATELCRCQQTDREAVCADGIDDDCDGQTDCADSECAGLPCTDGQPCTANDTCRGISCVGSPVECSTPPNQLCYEAQGTCNAQGGCDYVKKGLGTACSDGNPCLVGQACDAQGLCLGGSQRDCDDQDPCTEDGCGAGGCVNTLSEDGASCGLGKVCQSGSCVDATTFCEIGGSTYSAGEANPANPCERCHPTTSPIAWSPQPDGLGCGAGRVCLSRSCSQGCFISGTYHADGAVNPANACQKCSSSSSTAAWSLVTNGTSCGTGKVCNGGSCATGCWISGAWYADGAANPANPCQQCTVATSTATWSNKAGGTACATGKVCSAGTCSTGCWISGAYHADGAVNPANPCQQCTAATSTTIWSNKTNGTTCGTDQICNAGACSSGCLIASNYYADGTGNPLNPCTQCTAATSTTAWSNKPGGTSCGTGEICNGGTCSAGCWVAGSYYANGTTNPLNACTQCTSATSTAAWSNKTNGTSCGTGKVCSAGTCSTGCWISGVYYADGAVNPTNACQQCTAATSTTAWSNKTNGTSCGTGQICNAGACSSGCLISGTYYANGTANPTNACQQCTAATSTTAWSNKANGLSCGTGQVCNAGTCSSGCWISSTYYASGAADSTNCKTCVPATSTTTWTNRANGYGCASGKVCNAGACSSGCWISSTYYASGAADSTNCKTCVPATSTTTWTNRANGYGCASGKVCNAGACSTGCWILSTFREAGDTSPANSCEECSPGKSTTGWSDKANGTVCGAISQCCSGSCVAKNAIDNCGSCGVDCYRALGSCQLRSSGGYACSCSTNLQCQNAIGDSNATCWTTAYGGDNRCQCQCPSDPGTGNTSCNDYCGAATSAGGGKCMEAHASGGYNYCFY